MNGTDSTKHTPGEWEVDNRFSCHSYVKAGARILFQTECNRAGESEESKANAQLIAAAPEMLSALKAARDVVKEHGGFISYNPVWEQVGAAISKVEEVKS